MAKSLFTFFTAAASAEPKIKDNILHHLSLRAGNLFDLWLCFPTLSTFRSSCLVFRPVAAAAVLIFYNPALARTRTCS